MPEPRATVNLARVHVSLADQPYLTRVDVVGADVMLPCSGVEIRQAPNPRDENVLVLRIPLEFVDIEQADR